MRSEAKSVDDYLASLPDERRRALSAVRRVILDNLDPDYEEAMAYGMIGYSVPHRVYPPGYHVDPRQGLPYAGLASQKHYLGCVRFKRLDDLPLDVVAEAIRRTPAADYIAHYELALRR